VSTSVSLTRAKIERVVSRDPKRGPSADFYWLTVGGRWFCCTAFQRDREWKLSLRQGSLTLEEASVVMSALQMAANWIAGEQVDATTHEAYGWKTKQIYDANGDCIGVEQVAVMTKEQAKAFKDSVSNCYTNAVQEEKGDAK
jgi:hypothetical protein